MLVHQAFGVCAAVSLVSCAAVLVSHARHQSFPSPLLLWRVLCNLLLSLQFMAFNLTLVTSYETSDGEERGIEVAQHVCTPAFALVTQLCMFASLSWFGCLSLDLYLTTTRPFSNPADRTAWYHAFVWSGSLLTGLVASVRAGYRPLYNICWVAEDPRGAPPTMRSW